MLSRETLFSSFSSLHRRVVMVTLTLLVATQAFGNGVAHSSSLDGEEEYIRVAERVPEFGGAFFEGDQLQIWLTKPSDELVAQAKSALVEFAGRDFDVEDYVARPADYGYLDLIEWNGLLSDLHEVVHELVFIGVSQSTNRITIAVTSIVDHESDIEAELDRLGVPHGAVELTQSEGVIPHTEETNSINALGIAAIIAAVLGIGALAIITRRRLTKNRVS